MSETAQPQLVEHGLAGPPGRHPLGPLHQHGQRCHDERYQTGQPEDTGRTGGDAVVDAVPNQGRQGEPGPAVQRDQDQRSDEQPTNPAQQVGQPERRLDRRRRFVGRSVSCGGQRRDPGPSAPGWRASRPADRHPSSRHRGRRRVEVRSGRPGLSCPGRRPPRPEWSRRRPRGPATTPPSARRRPGCLSVSAVSAVSTAVSASVAEAAVPEGSWSLVSTSSNPRNCGDRSRSSAAVPMSTTRPRSTSAIRSARSRVERRCAMSSVVRSAVTARRVAWMAASVAGSTALVASSRISSRGSVSRALANASRCRWPPESVEATLADHGVVAVRQASDELVRLGGAGGSPDLLARRVRPAVGDVLGDPGREQERLFEHHPHRGPQVHQRQLPDVDAADRHPAASRIVEAGEQQRDRRLAGAGCADQRDRLARSDVQVETGQHRLVGEVAEIDSGQVHPDRSGRQGARQVRVGHRRAGVDHVEDPLDAGPGLLGHRQQHRDRSGSVRRSARRSR